LGIRSKGRGDSKTVGHLLESRQPAGIYHLPVDWGLTDRVYFGLAGTDLPISLWFWADLNEEIAEQPRSPIKLTFFVWRWAVSIYCILGAIAQIPVLQCAFKSHNDILATPLCRAWLEAPWGFREFFHSTTRPWFLAGIGTAGLIIYVLYLSHFVLFRLGKQGRSATGQ
jgi:hypothetical protein